MNSKHVDLDAFQKDAYRYLLYWAMLDIRGIAWYRFRPWRPWTIRRQLQFARRAGYLADAMHNLAYYASIDFRKFDEAEFWRAMEYAETQSPMIDPTRYRTLFHDRVQELRNAVT